ncbi:MAG: CmpA/NrtA family ABC transporter substrate-binding protein [Stellaceae bacterium]
MSRTVHAEARRLRLGVLRLTDAAPLIIAKELGFFAAEGLEVVLSVEPSWANIADKLAYGLLDGAVMLPPLAFAISLGLRGAAACPLVVPLSLSLGGNTVTLSTELAGSPPENADALAAARALAARLAARRGDETPALAVVHAFSTHNLLLRYWLAAGGIDPERDVRLVVIPPARVVDALRERRIEGFCAGAPWGLVAARDGLGATVATSHGIWRNGPEKIFALPAAWAERHPDDLQAALRALLRAARFCDAPERAVEIASLLAQEAYLDMPAATILASLPGAGDGTSGAASVFFDNAATYPWRSHALWFLREMARWGLIGADLDDAAIAKTIYRPDLYAIAAKAMGISVPLRDRKTEGTHDRGWTLEARPSPIAMWPDLFCDGATFDPQEPVPFSRTRDGL